MDVTVSLSDDDAEYLDRYAENHGLSSRSAVLRRAVRLLRSSELGAAYEDAWNEWAETGEAAHWESTGAANSSRVGPL
jgi:Arc/MetJ-type ribon-helix-helix transcriptional regulator